MGGIHPFSNCQYREAILEATGKSPSLDEIGHCDGPVVTITIQRKEDGKLVVHTVCDGHAKRLQSQGFEYIQK
jgi:hypothetical protein